MTHASGRELLAIDPQVSSPECPALNGKPRRPSTLELEGAERRARSRRGHGIALVVLDSKLRFVRGVACRIDGRPMHLLVAIDTLDHVRRVRLAKRLPALVAREPDDPARLADALLEQADAKPAAPAEPSPAARRLLARLELAPPAPPATGGVHEGGAQTHGAPSDDAPSDDAPSDDAPSGGDSSGGDSSGGDSSGGDSSGESTPVAHLVALAKAGLAPVVAELIARGDLLELEHGHLIVVSNYRRLGRDLAPGRLPLSPADLADLWGCSRGRVRAILERMVGDGLLRRDRGRYTPVHGEGGGDADHADYE